MNNITKQKVFDKTQGHCHFCGDPINLEAYGLKKKKEDDTYDPGAWQIDHIVQRANGGANILENYMPICTECNGLRWFRDGKEIHRIMLLGIIAVDEIDKGSDTGKALDKLFTDRKKKNIERRLKRQLAKEQQI